MNEQRTNQHENDEQANKQTDRQDKEMKKRTNKREKIAMETKKQAIQDLVPITGDHS